MNLSLGRFILVSSVVLLLTVIYLIWLWNLICSLLNNTSTQQNQNSSLKNIHNLEKVENLQFKEDAVLSDKDVAMDSPILVNVVRKLLIPPSTFPYNFVERHKYLLPRFNPSAGQTQAVADILTSFGADGFFIECGANDGEWHSNTFWLERTLGWKGLLIEADPRAFLKLQQKHRNAWSGHFCLSNLPFPSQLPFYQTKDTGGIMSGLLDLKRNYIKEPTMIQCIPLYTVLLALRRTTVDYFSLDVEGSEIEVLKTVPFDKVIFKVITIEYIGIKEGKEGLVKFMTDKGYILYRIIEELSLYATDCIFIHKSVAAQLTPKQNKTTGRHYKIRLSQINTLS